MGRHSYCTYFDHRYLTRGLAMIRSLRRYVFDAQMFVLCLDQAAADILAALNEPGIHAIRLADLEDADPSLLKAKADGRIQIEYYFTCTPSLIIHVMRHAVDSEVITYLDGDLGFFGDPQPIYDEMGQDSVLIIPHRFPPPLRARERFGLYNVGWVSFRRDTHGQSCVAWWRDRTLEWCCDRVDEENQRFADQRYLDRFPQLFPATHVLRHKGANLAPWNLGGHSLSLVDGSVIVDGTDRLIFFHFHGIKPSGNGVYFPRLEVYGLSLERILREAIYVPYLTELRRIEREVFPLLPDTPIALRELDNVQNGNSVTRLKERLKIFRSFITGAYIRLPPT